MMDSISYGQTGASIDVLGDIMRGRSSSPVIQEE